MFDHFYTVVSDLSAAKTVERKIKDPQLHDSYKLMEIQKSFKIMQTLCKNKL